MKRFISVFLLLVMTFIFFGGCGKDDGTSSSDSSSGMSSSTPSGVDDPAALMMNAFSADISSEAGKSAVDTSYVLVHQAGSDDASEAALSLSEAFSSASLTLTRRDSAISDSQAESDAEILVGMIDNREEIASAVSFVKQYENAVLGAYAITVSDGKIGIIADTKDALTRAVDTFISLFVAPSGVEVYASMTLQYVYDKAGSTESATAFYTPDSIKSVSSAAAFTLDGVPQTDFSPEQLSYEVVLSSFDYPVLSMTAAVPNATVKITQPNAFNRGTGKVVITALDGTTKSTYQVKFTMAEFVSIDDAEVTFAANGAQSFLTLISDDGDYLTAELMAPILYERGLKVEIGMISNNLATITSATKDEDGKWTFEYTVNNMQKQMADKWKALMEKYPGVFAIACHSASHQTLGFDEVNLAKETLGAQYVLRQIFPDQEVLVWIGPGISSPTADEENYRAYELYVPGNFLCSRGGTSGDQLNSMTREELETKDSVLSQYRPADKKYKEIWNLSTATLRNETTQSGQDQYQTFLRLLNKAQTQSGWASLFWHNVYEHTPSNEYHITASFFEKVMDDCVAAINTGKVANLFFHDTAAYIYERDCEDLSITAKQYANRVEVSLTDSLDDAWFHTPLTVKLYVSGDIAHADSLTVKDANGEIVETIVPKTDAKGTFLYVNVIPDTGVYTVTVSD